MDKKPDYSQWLLEHRSAFTHAVTLTMKQVVAAHNAHNQLTFISIDKQKASENFRHFMNRLNRSCYGSAFSKHGKRAFVAPVIEGLNGQTHVHYHCAMGFPDRSLLISEIETLIRVNWNQTLFGAHQTEIDVQEMYGDKWMSYIQKHIDRNGDHYDVNNLWLPN